MERRVADIESLHKARHEHSTQSKNKSKASIPKKQGVNDGFLFTYKCTLRITLSYAAKTKKTDAAFLLRLCHVGTYQSEHGGRRRSSEDDTMNVG